MRALFAPNENIREGTDSLLWLGLFIQRSIRSSTVTVATSATKIPTTPLANRKVIMIINISTSIVYVGGSSVTTSNGWPIYQRAALTLYIEDNIDIYGIAGASAEVRILEGA